MRKHACAGLLLLATGACAHIPEVIRLEVDGSTVEIKKKVDIPVDEDRTDDGTAHDAGRR